MINWFKLDKYSWVIEAKNLSIELSKYGCWYYVFCVSHGITIVEDERFLADNIIEAKEKALGLIIENSNQPMLNKILEMVVCSDD